MEKVELSQLFTEENKYRYDSISINNEFAKMIISSIPENITQLEKAIYVYIKLCKLLSYDDEFLLYITRALSKKEMSSTNHTKIDNLANINESNNSVVCWEFVAIYGKILSMIGINSYVYDTELFEDAPVEVVDEREYFEQRYGKWHPGFAVNVDNQIFSISINAMVGDLSLAKHNYELKEIKSLHNDEEEKKKFKETINKVYGMVTNGAEIKPYNFEKEVDDYIEITDNLRPVKIEDKIAIFFSKVKQSEFLGLEFINDVFLLGGNIFNEKELKDNCFATIIGKRFLEEQKKSIPIIVFAINKTSIKDNPNENEYYILEGINGLVPISLQQLQESFNIGDLDILRMVIEYQEYWKESGIMLNKLRNINNKLINYYKDNDIEYKKQLKIKNILIDDSCFHNIKIEVAYSILRDLKIAEEDLRTVYSQLISPLF